MVNTHLTQSLLGIDIEYVSKYQPDLLFPIPRNQTRQELKIDLDNLPFQGEDIWNAFELSWLNAKGKPVVAIGEFRIPHSSPKLIESKSFKLYLNSLNNTHYKSINEVHSTLVKDLSAAVGSDIKVTLIPLAQASKLIGQLSGICLDDLDVSCDAYLPEKKFMKVEDAITHETLTSNLFKSNCPVTGQPDWASIQIEYSGRKINHSGLLQYLISFRNHDGFHEDCVERIFTDIMNQCAPQKLFVYARYTRRGGLDINPYRANYEVSPPTVRLCRQ